MNQALTKIVEENGLEAAQSNLIVEKFSDFLNKAKGWEEKAKTIVITDPSQVAEMKIAREARLELKEIRVNTEKVRKELKEDSLKKGKVIDGIANFIKDLISPIEDYLEKQEKFAENIEKERKDKIYLDRVAKLSEYNVNPSLYNLKEMSDEGFVSILSSAKLAFDAQVAIDKANEKERERIAKEDAEKQEKIRLDNERLAKENAEKDAIIEKERKEAAEREKKERDAREKVEAELKARKDEEEKLKKAAEAKAKKEKEEKAEADRQAALAPEKDKLFAWAESLKATKGPQYLSPAAELIVKQAEKKLLAIAQEIKEQIKSL